MSKNLTRKGLALGAIVALGSSLFAGAPAFAAASLSVVPDSGTGFTVLASDSFKIRTLGVDYSLTSSSVLNYKITKPSSTASVGYTLSNHDTSYGSNTPASFSTTTVDYIKSGATATVGSRPSLVINPSITSTGASEAYVVQAFIESGAADGLDAGDTVVSSPVTINFVKSLASTITLDQVAIGQPLTGTVKFDNADFNYGQTTLANTGVRVKEGSAAFAATAAVTREADNKNLEYSISYSTVDAGDVIAAKTEVIGYDSDSTLTSSPVVYSTAPAASNAAAQDTTITAGENIKVGSATAHVIRTGTKTFTYRVDFYKEAGKVNLVAAGQPVVLTATEMGTNTVDTTDVIRINGKKITGTNLNSDTATLNTVTDAKGGVDITITSDLASALDKIRVTATAAGTQIASDVDFVWNDAVLTTFNKVDAPLTVNSITVLRGSVVSQKYALRDQFGKLFTSASTTYRLKATKTGGTLVLDTTADFVAGEATLTFTDNTTSATMATVVTATLQQKTTGDFGDYTTGTLTSSTAVTRLNVVTTAQAAVKVTPLTALQGSGYTAHASTADGVATNTVPRAAVVLRAIDLRSNTNGAGLGVTSGNNVKLAGTAYNADGSPAAGVSVTLAAAGVYFSTSATADSYVSANTITVQTETDGTYLVYGNSNKGGATAITITAGTATKTQNVKFAAAAAGDGSAIVITAPESSLAGRSVDVSVLLTDKYGAPVKTADQSTATFKIAVTGPGSYTTITNNTDADGLSAFKLIFGANDNGTAVVKVTYDADGDATVYSPVVVSKSILVGTAAPATSATAAVSGSTGKFYVSVTNAAAKKVVVKVAGKFFRSFTGTAAKKSVALKAPKGKHKVTVFVGGKLTTTKTITVK